MSLAFFVLVLAGVLAFVFAPLRRRADGAGHGRTEELLREKEGLVLLLRDLDFDHRTGKIATEDWTAARSEAERRAIEVLRALDDTPGEAADLEERLEQEIGRARARLRGNSVAS